MEVIRVKQNIRVNQNILFHVKSKYLYKDDNIKHMFLLEYTCYSYMVII